MFFEVHPLAVPPQMNDSGAKTTCRRVLLMLATDESRRDGRILRGCPKRAR